MFKKPDLPNWYRVHQAEASLLTPAMLLYPDRIQNNIDRMLAIAGGPARLRPHTKTHKLPQVVRMQMAAGIDKFKCATLAEARMLAETGVRDVLVAYPLVGEAAWRRLFDLRAAFPDTNFAVLADQAESVAALDKWAATQDQPLTVFLDIDNGMHRTGIEPGEAALALYRRIAEAKHLRPGGLHVYDGHIREEDPMARAARFESDFSPVQALIADIRSEGLPLPEVVCGGNITFPLHAAHAERTLSPGTCSLWDYGYSSRFPDIEFQHAAVLATSVVSKPAGRYLTLNAGHKAVASEMQPPRLHLLDVGPYQMTVHSEEHMVIEPERPGDYRLGEVLYGIPYHICPTMALHEEVYVVENGEVVDRWRLAARHREY